MSNNNYFSILNKDLKKTINEGATLLLNGPVFKLPYEYKGWRSEQLASKKTAYLGTYLNQAGKMDVSGPDVAIFFNRFFTNNFDNFKIGRIRHGIICNTKGQIMADGIIMKLDENLYRTYCLTPILDFLLDKYGAEYDIKAKDTTTKEFLFQIDGPRSYDIVSEALDNAAKLKDLKFTRHDLFTINDKKIRVLRMGMTGNLAYEIHGDAEFAEEVYSTIWKVGQKYGMKKLGSHAYVMGHTEGGFSNMGLHYPMPWHESEEAGFAGLEAYMNERPGIGYTNDNRVLTGSLGNELQSRFVTPYDVGWDNLVKFNHDFVGKKALERLAAIPLRKVVTLEWNVEDIMDIYGSQFRGKDTQPYDYIDDQPNDMDQTASNMTYHADKVLAGNREIGISVGRQVSEFYHRMISLAYVSPEYAKEGNELTVVWGYPGHPQKNVHVKVVRTPYLDLENNRAESVGGSKKKE